MEQQFMLSYQPIGIPKRQRVHIDEVEHQMTIFGLGIGNLKAGVKGFGMPIPPRSAERRASRPEGPHESGPRENGGPWSNPFLGHASKLWFSSGSRRLGWVVRAAALVTKGGRPANVDSHSCRTRRSALERFESRSPMRAWIVSSRVRASAAICTASFASGCCESAVAAACSLFRT